MREVRIVIHMDADKPFEGRFCWPAQDRVRAASPLTAPRISPVFTASVSSRSEVRVSCSFPASSPAVHRLSSRLAASTPGQLGGPRREGPSCWYSHVGSADQPLLSLVSSARFSGLVPGSWFLAPAGANAGESEVGHPDWRVFGEQDRD